MCLRVRDAPSQQTIKANQSIFYLETEGGDIGDIPYIVRVRK